MPLGWERINVKQTTPNKNIVFIKPLPGPNEKNSKDFLERIAAQCLPIMNKHHLAVVSLEEYEYNTEFLGRNFNNGEVIQLVLKSASGRWLPFSFVQMVMMHELAHNKQMNHSKAFWAVRNEFAAEMKGLWEKNYTGDGLWGRGVLLENGLFKRDLDKDEAIPEHTCGGTFRSRGGKKRKAEVRPKITWKEQKERRIRKKFGVNGVALGAGEETKVKLEKGEKPAVKPRVAGSMRGRELRAAAALARFDVVKKEESQIKDEELVTDSEAESEGEDDVKIKAEPDDAVDIDGRRLLDRHGGGMVKVCEDEDNDVDEARNELLDLHIVPGQSQRSLSSRKSRTKSTPTNTYSRPPKIKEEADEQLSNSSRPPVLQLQESSSSQSTVQNDKRVSRDKPDKPDKPSINEPARPPVEEGSTAEASCPVCSVTNEQSALTCMVCANVLKPEFVPGCWSCKNGDCGQYVNAGDVNLCGVCGTRKEVLH